MTRDWDRHWDMIRIQHEDKEYPSNMGKNWTSDEETLLLEELNNNIDIETIAQKHNRTVGGINSRRQEIAYKMYLKNISFEEIHKRVLGGVRCERRWHITLKGSEPRIHQKLMPSLRTLDNLKRISITYQNNSKSECSE